MRNNKTSPTIKATYTYTYDAGDNMLTKATPFEDDFNDGNYTGWTVGTGTASAASGYMQTTGYSNFSQNNTDADLEQWISYYVDPSTTATGLYARVWARYASSTENIKIYLKGTEMRIYQKDDAVGTYLATNTAADTNKGVWYEMRIVADGTNLKVYRGERGHAMEEIFNTTVAVTTTSKLLCYAEANTVVRFDNIRVNTDSLSTTTTYAYNNANELTSMTDYNGTTSFAYDAWGRRTSNTRGSQVETYKWRYGSKLAGIDTSVPDGYDLNILYGANHNMRESTVGGVTTSYDWHADNSIISEENESGELLRTYVGCGAHVDGIAPSSGTYEYYLHDRYGSTRRLYNQGKSLTGDLEYTPDGEEYIDSVRADVTHRNVSKQWSTDDFVHHYYSGDGETVHLEDIGLLDDVRRDPGVYGFERQFVNALHKKVRPGAEELLARCGDGSTTVGGFVEERDLEHRYDFTWSAGPLFSLGRGTIFGLGKCAILLDCCTKCYKSLCYVHFYIRDCFEEPLYGFPFEPGGTIYRIHGDWYWKWNDDGCLT